jgi:hypothetical protein
MHMFFFASSTFAYEPIAVFPDLIGAECSELESDEADEPRE